MNRHTNEGYESVRIEVFFSLYTPTSKQDFSNANFWAQVKQSQLLRSHQLRDEELGVWGAPSTTFPNGNKEEASEK